jgi:hypothetical protein
LVDLQLQKGEPQAQQGAARNHRGESRAIPRSHEQAMVVAQLREQLQLQSQLRDREWRQGFARLSIILQMNQQSRYQLQLFDLLYESAMQLMQRLQVTTLLRRERQGLP